MNEKIYEWTIIGGGIHGYTQALHFYRRGTPVNALRIIDHYPTPLEQWQIRTENTGMTFLRSAGSLNLGASTSSLLSFLETQGYHLKTATESPYFRPSLTLFNTASLFEIKPLLSSHLQAHAHHITKEKNLYRIHLHSSPLERSPSDLSSSLRVHQTSFLSKSILIAPGKTVLNIPQWSFHHPLISHIFAPEFKKELLRGKKIALIGTGISAINLAHFLLLQGKEVLLFGKHPNVSHFDSMTSFMGKRGNLFFRSLPLLKRLELIRFARNFGSINTTLYENFIKTPLFFPASFHHLSDPIQKAFALPSSPEITLETPAKSFTVDHVVLCTGFRNTFSYLNLFSPEFLKENSLETFSNYPILTPFLSWNTERIFFSGEDAALEIGPHSNGILGALKVRERLNF